MTMKSVPIGICDDGDPPRLWVAVINYENIDGRHIFTSDSIPGLLVASVDAKKVLNQLVPTIESLINKNLDATCTVLLGDEFKEFEKNHLSPKVEKPALKSTYAIIKMAA